MWCYTKKNGTVLYRERYKDPLTGKDKIMSVSKPHPKTKIRHSENLPPKLKLRLKNFNAPIIR